MGFYWIYPLVMTNIAIESGHRNDVSFPMVIFHSYVTVYERVSNMALVKAHKYGFIWEVIYMDLL